MSRPHCVIVARSGRALAASASKAGYLVHVIDAFADVDIQAETVQRCQYYATGFNVPQLQAIYSDLQARYPLELVVVGSGLEQQPDLLQQTSSRVTLYSNGPDTLAHVTDPFRFYAMLERAGLPGIPVYREWPGNTGPLLCKRIGGMGGEHIKRADESIPLAPGFYYQPYIEGAVYSVVFVADGRNHAVVGYNSLWLEQHCDNQPFLLGGANSIQPAAELQAGIENCLEVIVPETGLRGLCGMDFVIDRNGEIRILEINPRPPATFELHEGAQSLFAAHLQSFAQPVAPYRRCDRHRAYVIIYATENIAISTGFDWPAWVKDRPAAGTQFEPCQPVCTIHAESETTSELLELLERRRQALCSQLYRD
ncbi:MAG: ATP-grasp domain-containing protein [Gammaproteobacteria bacterium]